VFANDLGEGTACPDLAFTPFAFVALFLSLFTSLFCLTALVANKGRKINWNMSKKIAKIEWSRNT